MSLKDYITRLTTDESYRASLSREEMVQTAKGLTRVLIIEDDEGVGPLLELKLGQWGYNACLVTNGTDGLRILSQERPDILLTDLNYPPRGGGAHVVKTAVRSMGYSPDQIIMFTTDTIAARQQLEGIPITIVEKPESRNLKAPLDDIVTAELRKAIAVA